MFCLVIILKFLQDRRGAHKNSDCRTRFCIYRIRFCNLQNQVLLQNRAALHPPLCDCSSGYPFARAFSRQLPTQPTVPTKGANTKQELKVRDIDPQNDLTFVRVRSKKYEIIIAPGIVLLYQSFLNIFLFRKRVPSDRHSKSQRVKSPLCTLHNFQQHPIKKEFFHSFTLFASC